MFLGPEAPQRVYFIYKVGVGGIKSKKYRKYIEPTLESPLRNFGSNVKLRQLWP